VNSDATALVVAAPSPGTDEAMTIVEAPIVEAPIVGAPIVGAPIVGAPIVGAGA
jgi:hypothetical protein